MSGNCCNLTLAAVINYRCLSKTATDPDHAEQVMSEVCELGGLIPNATTHILLTEIRVRFEQLLGL